MLQNSPKPMNAAQRAWATRRAREAARADIAKLNKGIATPAPALKTSKPVVDLNIDHHAIGCALADKINQQGRPSWLTAAPMRPKPSKS